MAELDGKYIFVFTVMSRDSTLPNTASLTPRENVTVDGMRAFIVANDLAAPEEAFTPKTGLEGTIGSLLCTDVYVLLICGLSGLRNFLSEGLLLPMCDAAAVDTPRAAAAAVPAEVCESSEFAVLTACVFVCIGLGVGELLASAEWCWCCEEEDVGVFAKKLVMDCCLRRGVAFVPLAKLDAIAWAGCGGA